MNTCTLCRFETELDDVAIGTGSGALICLRCYDRETGNTRAMPKTLRRNILAALADIEVG